MSFIIIVGVILFVLSIYALKLQKDYNKRHNSREDKATGGMLGFVIFYGLGLLLLNKYQGAGQEHMFGSLFATIGGIVLCFMGAVMVVTSLIGPGSNHHSTKTWKD